MITELEQLVNICKKNDTIFIYGAGKNAKHLFMYLKEQGIDIWGFIVSSIEGNPDYLFGRPVIEIKQFLKNPASLILVSITQSNTAYLDIIDLLMQYKLQNAWFVSYRLMTAVKEHLTIQKLKSIFEKGNYHLNMDIPVEANHYVLTMITVDQKEYHWRLKAPDNEEQNMPDILKLFPQRTILEEFEKIYGSYYILHALDRKLETPSKTVAVYMAQSHADNSRFLPTIPDWIIPIQVGAALTEKKIVAIQDNTGINISDKNSIYSECTALYWIWKNAPKIDYIGLCHYRRHFDLSEEDFSRLVGADIDVLVTTPTFVNETVKTFFRNFISQTDMDYLLKAIKNVRPEYLPEAEKFLDIKFFPPCNISIMKYDIFQKYANYVFSITFEIERYYRNLRYVRNDRYMGYLIECLLGIFLIHHKEELKIAYTDMLFYS